MIGTVTEMETKARCEWRWDFNSMNRMSLEPIMPLAALYIGTLEHKVLDIYASTTIACSKYLHTETEICQTCSLPYVSHLEPMRIYDYFAGESLNKIIERYTEQMGIPPSGMELMEISKNSAFGREMFANYVKYYGQPLPDELEFISTEQSLILDVDGTEHCVCYYNPNIRCSCQHPHCTVMYSKYTHCLCEHEHPFCSCRQKHKLESTLDGVIRHKATGNLFILENKTFTYHPNVERELAHNHQFMGYTWAAHTAGIPVKGIFYNGLWKRTEVSGKWTEHDLFMREYIPYQPYELATWHRHAAVRLVEMFDPFHAELTRTVHPVGGCNGVNNCNFKALCTARFKNINYETLLKTRYTKRERTSIFAEEEA